MRNLEMHEGITQASAQTTPLPTLVGLALRAHAPLWGIVLAYGVMTWWVTGQLPKAGRDPAQLLQDALLLLVVASPVFVLWRLVSWARRGLPESPIRQLLADARGILGDRGRLAHLIVLFPTFFLFLKFFAVFKGNIAYLNPFAWDEALMRLDAWLHGGRQPWEWLAPLLSPGVVTFIVNVAYNFWFFVAVGALLWAVGMRRPDEARIRFLFAFLFVWIVGGSLMALFFSSAGPAYYSRLGLSPDPYVPLMEHLRTVARSWPIWALETQDMLWRHYLEKNVELGGISAFPSMHNAQATLVALLAWRVNRRAGWLLTAFAAGIAIGSVWLGWHYAVDAHAGIALAVVGWWLAGFAARAVLRGKAAQALAVFSQRA